MTTSIIARVNNVDIVSTSDKQKLVPITLICEALGIDAEVQIQNILSHYLLAPTTILSKVILGDEKECEMLCLPLMYVMGWIFSDEVRLAASPDRVMELHKVLWLHLTEERNSQITKIQEQEQQIESLRREIVELEQYYEDEMLLEEEE